MSSTKQSKSKRKADLRRKNMGLGIGTIDVNNVTSSTISSSKKIRFDDDVDFESDNEYENVEQKEKEEGGKAIHNVKNSDDDDDDDDDEVEQVSAAVAKDEALQIRAAERETRKVEKTMTQKRKRKKKIVTEVNTKEIDVNDDDLDEEFLAMVDSARENESKMKKLKEHTRNAHDKSIMETKKLGRHTTFISDDRDLNSDNIIDAGHNIEVVVLPSSSLTNDNDDDRNVNTVIQEKAMASLSSDLSTKPSEAALQFCRGRQFRNQSLEKKGEKVAFKRSRKMKYKLSLGKPAANFVVKKKINRD